MFSNRKSVVPLLSNPVLYDSEEKILSDSGKTYVVSSQTSESPTLPPYQEYSLGSLLNAGVNLEQVNPAILGTTYVSENDIVTTLYNLEQSLNKNGSGTVKIESIANSNQTTPTDDIIDKV